MKRSIGIAGGVTALALLLAGASFVGGKLRKKSQQLWDWQLGKSAKPKWLLSSVVAGMPKQKQ